MSDSSAKALKAFWILLTGLTVIAWGVALFHLFVTHAGYPMNWPLFLPSARFSDLTDYDAMIRGFWSGSPLPPEKMPIYNYPAPALFVYSFFLMLFPRAVVAYLAFAGLLWVGAFELLRRQLRTRGAAILCATVAVCSYPFLYTIDRGNLELVIFAFVFGGVIFFARGQFRWTALCFALATCIKPFPALFFFLLLTRKKYKEIFGAGIFIGVVNFLSLLWMGPNLRGALETLKNGTEEFLNTYYLGYRVTEIQFDHSLFSVVKQGIRLAEGLEQTELYGFSFAYALYLPLAGSLMIWATWHFWNRPALNQLFAVITMMLMLPPVSYDYTLIHLYIVWGFFVLVLVRDGYVTKAGHFLTAFAILMTPQSYLTTAMIGLGGQVKALALLYLLYLAATVKLPSSRFGEPSPQ